MKIGLAVDSSTLGGIETHVLNLASELKMSGLEVSIIFVKFYQNHPLYKKLDGQKIPYYFANGSVYSFFNTLRKIDIDVLHTHGYKAGIWGRIFGTILNLKVISTYHAGELGTGKVLLYNVLDWYSAFLCTPITVSEEIARRLFVKSTTMKNFVPIPNEMRYSDSNIVAFVGRLSSEKGPDIFCQLPQRVETGVFHVYGDGPLRVELEKHDGKKIKFFGQVDNVNEIWSDVSLLCMPSRFEGLPMAALEAMSYGIPVVAFNVGNLDKLIVNDLNGWLIEVNDVEAMAVAIRRFFSLSENEKRRMRDYSKKNIEENYSSKAVVKDLVRIYKGA